MNIKATNKIQRLIKSMQLFDKKRNELIKSNISYCINGHFNKSLSDQLKSIIDQAAAISKEMDSEQL